MAKLEVSPPKPCKYSRPPPSPAWLNSTIASPSARMSTQLTCTPLLQMARAPCPASLPGLRSGTSERSGIRAAVEQHVLAGDVAGMPAAQESAGGAEFRRVAEALCGDGVHARCAHGIHA